jgi:hypothetical protein
VCTRRKTSILKKSDWSNIVRYRTKETDMSATPQITGKVTVNITLNNQQGGNVYSRVSTPPTALQTFPVFGNELLTALNLSIPPGGVSVTLPSGSGATVEVIATSLADGIATYTFVPDPNNQLNAGQNVSVVNCVNNAVFNITNGVILNVNGNQFTVAVSNADIGYAAEYVATATTSGISMLYLRNAGPNTINITWTPSGGTTEAILPLPAGGTVTLTFPNANSGIVALSFSSDTLASAEVTNVALTNSVATLTTATYHGFSVGELVTTTGITNNSNLFNVTAQLITAVTPTTFSFALYHANVTSAAATGTSPEATVASVPTVNSQVEYALLA